MPLFVFYGAVSPFTQPVFNADFFTQSLWNSKLAATEKYNYPKRNSPTGLSDEAEACFFPKLCQLI